MSDRTVEHATVVVERTYDAPPERVFNAWADPKIRILWDVPGEGWETTEFTNDFRIGGRETSRFGRIGDPKFYSDGRILDIVPNARIVSAGTMPEGDRRISTTLCTVELLPAGDGTRLILTDQSAYLDGGDNAADREKGWTVILENLGTHLRDALVDA